jgi:hypothetical protein
VFEFIFREKANANDILSECCHSILYVYILFYYKIELGNDSIKYKGTVHTKFSFVYNARADRNSIISRSAPPITAQSSGL